MDFFDKIDELEKQASETIENKLNIFKDAIDDYSNFIRNEKEIHPDKFSKELLTEIKNSKIKNLILKNFKLDTKYETSSSLYSEIKKKTTTIGFNSPFNNTFFVHKLLMDGNRDTHTFGLLKSENLSHFNQETMTNNKKLFSKENELIILTDLITHNIKKHLRSRISNFLMQQGIDLNTKRKHASMKNSPIKNSPLKIQSKSKSRSRGTSPMTKYLEEFKSNNSPKKLTCQGTNGNRTSRELYPEPLKHEDLLKTKFVLSKIFEFKYHGNLHKKYDLKTLKNEFKINKEKVKYDLDLEGTINNLDKLIENRKLSNFNIMKMNSINNRNNSAVDKDQSRREHDIMIETNSNYYTKIDRNKMNLKLNLKKPNEKGDTRYFLMNLNTQNKFEKNFFGNIKLAKEKKTVSDSLRMLKKKELLNPITHEKSNRVLSSRIKIKY